MSMFWIVYFVGCAVAFLSGITFLKKEDSLTIGMLIEAVLVSTASWVFVFILLFVYVSDLEKVRRFLNKKL